jgi:hypothetical protein
MNTVRALLTAVIIGGVGAKGEEGISVNVAGYTRVELFATTSVTRLYLVHNDYEGLTSPRTIANTLSNQVPIGSQVILWDDASQTYKPSISRIIFVNWGAAGSNTLPRGMGFWIRMPAMGAPTNVTMLFTGELPDEATAPVTTITAVPGLNLDGYPYPGSVRWTNTQYAKRLPWNSRLLRWDASNQVWFTSIGKSALGWGTTGNAVVFEPAEGFFTDLYGSTNLVFDEAKPYAWP